MTRAPAEFAAKVEELLHASADGPGAVVAVLEDGQEIFASAYGMANINNSVPMARDTIIRIGSQTKQFTVLLILMLEAEGKLSLSDRVQEHLPYVPQLEHDITLGHLAQNASGYRDHLESMIYAGLSIVTPSTRQAARDVISQQDRLNFAPGTAMIYSNAGFFMLSEIIEKVEGKSFNAVLKERITDPLGMKDTALMPRDATVMKRLAAHYCRREGEWSTQGWGLDLGGEGGMISTLDDMIIWLKNLSDPKVGTPQMYERMATPTVFANGETGFYGMGLVTDTYRGRRAVGHGGTVAGGKSESTRYVDDGLGIIIIANHDQISPFAIARRIADAYFETEIPAPIDLVPGRYREVEGNDVIEIAKGENGPNFLSAGGTVSFDFAHPGGAKPERAVTDLVLTPAADGTIKARFCGTPRTYAPLPEGCKAVKPLTGRYRNAAQNLDVEIWGDCNTAQLRLRSDLGAFAAELVAVDSDLWLMLPSGATLRPGQAWTAMIQVTSEGFAFNTERMKHLDFKKS
ncbi:serine hydrolase domain-containing protein [Pelagibacterium sp.]|uniref:serine hydrolase domain-containing protein n=1 Tax=Pelagibacterium sp. TaxID=1967288 RepID=UPI003A92E2BE